MHISSFSHFSICEVSELVKETILLLHLAPSDGANLFNSAFFHVFSSFFSLVFGTIKEAQRNSLNLFHPKISKKKLNYCYLKVLRSCCVWKLSVDRKIDIRGVVRVFGISSWKKGNFTFEFTKIYVKYHHKSIQREVYLNWVFILGKFHSANFLWRSKCTRYAMY